MSNLLHSIPLYHNKNKYPDIINAIVEIPKDTSAKYEYDINYGILKLDRCLISSMRYPVSYGFVPQTIAEDNDPLDILIYNSVPLECLSLVEVKPIGALHMIDDGINDYKVIGIPVFNPNKYDELSDLKPMFLTVCEDFFRHYKNNDVKKKQVVINGWVDKKETFEIINNSNKKYKNIYYNYLDCFDYFN